MDRIPQIIPPAGRKALEQWADVKGDAKLPPLELLAPQRLPVDLLPWVMTYRRNKSRDLTYGVVGEELRFLFGGNPRGKTVLSYADPATQAYRYDLIHRSLDEGIPFWYSGDVLFQNMPRQELGRLGLPTSTANGEALLIIYFLGVKLPHPLPPLAEPPRVDEATVVWLRQT